MSASITSYIVQIIYIALVPLVTTKYKTVFSLPFHNSLVDIHLLDPAPEYFSNFAIAAFICVNTSWRKIYVAALLFNELVVAKAYYTVHSSATCLYPVGLTKKLKSSNKNSKAFISSFILLHKQ